MSCFWQHKWKYTGVEWREYTTYNRFVNKWLAQRIYSIIKRRCTECGEVDTIERDGHWTKAELGIE